MKKLSFIFLAMLLSMVLVACGDNENNNGNDAPTPTDTDNDSNNANENGNTTNDAANNDVSDTSFDNGDYVYEIKEVEQMESGFEDGTQILAVELSFTNNTDEPTSPWMALGLSAEQETDVTVEGLDGANGLYPDDYKTELVEMGDTDIKPGATVDAVIGFEILYPGEPVRLYNFSFDDEILFEKVVETTE